MDQAAERGSKLIALRNWWLGKSPIVRLYFGGTACILFGLVLFHFDPKSAASTVAVYAAVVLCISAFLRESYALLVPKLELPLVKLLVTIVGVMALAAATGVSRTTINEATGQDASQFPSAVAFLVPISFVPVLALLIAFLGTIAVLLGFLWSVLMMLLKRGAFSDLEFFLNLARFFSGISIVLIAATQLGTSSHIHRAAIFVARYSALILDLQTNRSCAPLEGDRVTRINDDFVVIGRQTSDGPRFVRRACPITPDISDLPPPVKS